MALAASAFAALAGCASPPVNRTAGPLETVSRVDLDRYQGRWYEIARLPNQFEKNCEGVTADYARRPDGLISVVNTCREGAPDGPVRVARGRARIVDAATNAKLKVSFFGPFWGDYWILSLAEDYSLSLVGEPSGRYLWILARTPLIDEAVKIEALTTLATLGYDVSKLYFGQQPPVPDNPLPD
jgi:apolipoprotein D and lipocalin family protein